MYGFMPLNEKVDAVNNENSTLQSEIDVLKGYAANEKNMRAELEKIDGDIKKFANSYAVEVTPEDSIKIIKDMEGVTGTEVSNIGFSEAENIYASTFTNENGENVLAYASPLSVSYSTTYDGLKKVMDYINNYPEHMSVSDFSAVYNRETDKLTGNINIIRYSVTGLGNTYTEPAIDGVRLSTRNIFHTAE